MLKSIIFTCELQYSTVILVQNYRLVLVYIGLYKAYSFILAYAREINLYPVMFIKKREVKTHSDTFKWQYREQINLI